MAQRIEGGNSGAEERAGFGGVESTGHERDAFVSSNHILSIAAINVEAGDFFVGAGDEIAATAGFTDEAVSTVPAYADAIAFLPLGDAIADGIDYAGNLVARDARVDEAGPVAVFDEVVAEADTTGLDFDADFAWTGLRDVALDQFEVGSGLGHLCDEILRHRFSLPVVEWLADSKDRLLT